MSGTVRDERSFPPISRGYGPIVSRAGRGCGCAAGARADVAAADAFSGERLRSRASEPGSIRGDARANAARDGRGIGGINGRYAVGAHIGGPSLERLLYA